MRNVIIALSAVLAFVSCRQDPPPLIVVGSISIFVKNVSSDNLLDPAFAGNILDDYISIEYSGETFILNELDGAGLFSVLYDETNPENNTLEFGPLSADTHPGKTFTINWGDGTSDSVTFEFYKGKRDKDNIDIVQKIWLNGELQSDDSLVVTIVK